MRYIPKYQQEPENVTTPLRMIVEGIVFVLCLAMIGLILVLID